MTTHQPMPVQGYTEQSGENIAMVNHNKELEEVILRRLDDLSSNARIDKRWLALARTHIEEGFMAMNRAIFKPKRIDLPIHDTDEEDTDEGSTFVEVAEPELPLVPTPPSKKKMSDKIELSKDLGYDHDHDHD